MYVFVFLCLLSLGTAYLKSPLAKQDKHADVSANKSKLLEDDLTRGVLDLGIIILYK